MLLLIISNKSDLATDYLILKIKEMGYPFLRLNTEDYLSKWHVDFWFDRTKRMVQLTTLNGSFSVDQVTGAYIRQPKLPSVEAADTDREFIDREIGETLKSLWRQINDKLWLNAPHKILRSSNKPEQLKLAQELGMVIPPTCISAEESVILNFYNMQDGDIVAKAIKHGFIYDENQAKVATTQKLSIEDIRALKSYVKLPMIFQKRIEKKYDIRVTVVGEQVFAAAIFSQEHQETSTDWRISNHYDIELHHEKIVLPDDVSNFCRCITASYGLRYSAIDFILSTDNSYYFLEMNPNGQWAWIEQLLKYPIRHSIITELMSTSEEVA